MVTFCVLVYFKTIQYKYFKMIVNGYCQNDLKTLFIINNENTYYEVIILIVELRTTYAISA
jgi:hypothetical protein